MDVFYATGPRNRSRLAPFLAAILVAQSAFAVIESPTGTLVADANDGAVTYLVIDNDGDLVIDIEVTGAASGNGIYENIDTIDSTVSSSPGTITVAVSAPTTTTVTTTNAGTLTLPDSPTLEFSGIEDLNGGADTDTFVLDASLTGTISGGAGTDEIIGSSSPNSFVITELDGGAVGTTLFSSVENLTGGADVDTFALSAALSGTAQGGAGNDVFNLDTGGSAGSLNGGAGTDSLVGAGGNDSFDVFAADSGTANGSAFSNIENLDGGSGSDTFTFIAALSGTALGGAGDDVFNLNDGGNAASFDGGADNDMASYAGRTGGINVGLAEFSAVETIVGSGFDDTISLNGDQVGDITVDGGAGSDLFSVSSNSQVAGDLNVTNIEQVSAGANVTADNITFYVAGAIAGAGVVTAAGDIIMTLVGGGDAELQIGAGGSGGLLNITSTGGGVLGLSVTGGAGSDTLRMAIAGSDEPAWDISAANAGTVIGALVDIDFASIENLNAGGNADTFILNAGIDGLINGGAGLDTLIGSADPNSFVISAIDSGTVSSVNGTAAFTNIENLTGGPAADMFFLDAGISGLIDGAAGLDTLVGSAASNSFVVSSGDAGTVNSVSFVNVENLAGGDGQDIFLFNAALSGIADGSGGDDVFDVSPDIFVSIEGGAGNDEVVINGPNTNDIGLTSVENISYIPEFVVFKARGTVNSVAADLASVFSIGDSFELRYTFEARATDTLPSEDTGLYDDAVVEAHVEVGSYSADLSPTGFKRITVFDNSNGLDRYRVDLSGVSGPLAAGLPLGDQFPILLVTDFTGVALTDDELPTAGLDVGAFGQNDFIQLRFERPDESNAIVVATVDLVEVIPAYRDVPEPYWAADFISKIGENRITSGCGQAKFCPADEVTRAQMAVFLERGINGGDFVPPPASGNVFFDVDAGDFAAAFIEQLAGDGITSGCGGGNYCPDDSVTRAQMAVFLLRARYGQGYSPPPPQGVFADVDLGYWAVAWIEQLLAEGITSGCGGGNYCPNDPVTRAQMAVFLVRTFGL